MQEGVSFQKNNSEVLKPSSGLLGSLFLLLANRFKVSLLLVWRVDLLWMAGATSHSAALFSKIGFINQQPFSLFYI